jgi:hypothetical protein
MLVVCLSLQLRVYVWVWECLSAKIDMYVYIVRNSMNTTEVWRITENNTSVKYMLDYKLVYNFPALSVIIYNVYSYV